MISGPIASKLSALLCRVVVPLWILLGATFKLIEGDPNNLPRRLYTSIMRLEITNPDVLLWVLISLEFLAIGVMLFVPRLARLMAAFMLASFCLILINEIAGGASTCGCFGSISLPPWLMLSIDGVLLLGVILFAPAASRHPLISRNGTLATAVWTAALTVTSGFMLLGNSTRALQSNDGHTSAGGTRPTQPVDPDGPGQIPTTYVMAEQTQIATWVNKKWTDIPFARYMPSWPDPAFKGRWYVIFYSPTCDHCKDLLEANFFDDAPVPTIAVAVPETKSAIDPSAWNHLTHCRECLTEMTLPHGQHWLVDFPVVVAIEDNIVKCAKGRVAATNDNCLIWH